MVNENTQNEGQSTGNILETICALNNIIWGRNMRCEKGMGNY